MHKWFANSLEFIHAYYTLYKYVLQITYVARNVKDVCVSMYHFMQSMQLVTRGTSRNCIDYFLKSWVSLKQSDTILFSLY